MTLTKFIGLLCLNLLFCLTAFAGTPVKLFTASKTKRLTSDNLEYTSLTIDSEVMQELYTSRKQSVSLAIPYLGSQYIVDLEAYDLLADGFIARTSSGKTVDYNPGIYYRGKIAETGGMVAFSIFKNDIIAILSTADGHDLNLGKPLDGEKDEYVIYDAKHLTNPQSMECHAEELPEYAQQLEQLYENVESNKMGGCVNVYVEGDFTMFLVKGGVTQSINYITGLWNPVATIYDNDGMEVNISEIFIWDTADPYDTNDAGAALGDFKAENPSFNGDLAHLMAIGGNNLGGVAWLDVLCVNNFAYAYSNIGSNYNSFPNYSWSVMVVSHEMGHNVASPHTHNCSWAGGAIDDCYDTEGSCPPGPPPSNGGTIMSYCHLTSDGINFNNGFGPLPAALMVSAINGAGCLGGCTAPGDPPEADFTWNVIDPCVGGPAQVQYFDDSTENPTSWLWTFEGGTPSSSTLENPIVTYNASGTYDVSLEVSNNNGTDDITKNNIITIDNPPFPLFTVDILDDFAFFNNFSQFGDTYEWDYGDGFSGLGFEPFHQYEEDGTYLVTLEAFNECGSETYSLEITIATLPEAAFEYSSSTGCVPKTISYNNTSSNNSDSFVWTFPGGNPATSTDINPTVVYNVSGIYSATLVATNEQGSDSHTVSNFIVLIDTPVAGCTFTLTEATLAITNTTTNADSYLWTFGDGGTSTQANPTYTYSTGGTFTVTLAATNTCGTENHQFSIEIILEPTADFVASTNEGCADLTVTYTSQSIYADTYAWEFEGGNPATSTEANPTVVYEEAGIFDVSLTVSNAFGSNQLLLENEITVNDVPTANFTYSANSGTVSFINASSNATGYTWDFGDGNNTSMISPTHTYDVGGIYTVTLIAENECGQTFYSETIEVEIAPIASFTSTSTEGCADFQVTYQNQSINADTYAWSFPGGTPSTSSMMNPTITYSTAGVYDATLVVTNAYGTDEISIQSFIIIEDVPSTTFNYNVSQGTATFVNNTLDADSYLWDFGDGNTSTLEDPQNYYPESGTYTVTLIAENGCGQSTYVQDMVVTYAPEVAISADITTTCLPATVTFSSLALNAETLLWTFEGGNPATSTEANPIVTFANSGNYDVTLLATNSEGSTEEVYINYISVLPNPTANFTYVINGESVKFTYTGNGTSYLWDFGDGNTSTQKNPNHTYSTQDTYTVTVTATNACGDKSRTKEVIFYTEPLAGIGLEDETICVGESLTLVNTSTDNVTSYLWEVNGQSYTTAEPSISIDAVGSYSVSLTVSNPLFSNTIVVDDAITVIDKPTVTFTITELPNSAIQCDYIGEFGETYLWDFGDGNTSTMENPMHTYTIEGAYIITLLVSNQCGEESISKEFSNFTKPTADFSQSASKICVGQEVAFTQMASANAVDFLWEMPGATPATSSSKNPTVTYETAGTYSVTLTVSNPNGSDSYTITEAVIVLEKPVAAFDFDQNGSVLSFTNTSIGAENYTWEFGDGNTSTEVQPNYIYNTENTYTVVLTVSNICGEDQAEALFNNYTMPTADFTQNKQIVCVGENIRYNQAASANAVNFNWFMPGATPETSTAKRPLVSYDTPGTYDVTLTVSNPAGEDSVTKSTTVTVIDQPVVEFTSTRDLLTLKFSNTTLYADEYLWDFGDGNTSTEVEPTHTYASIGEYLVTLTASNKCGESSKNISIQANNKPTASFSLANATTLCAPAIVTFNNSSSSNVIDYAWSFPGGNPETSTEKEPTVTYPTAGSYAVELEVFSADGESDVLYFDNYIVVLGLPTAGFEYSNTNGSIELTSIAEAATAITWLVDGIEQSTENTFTFSPEFNGTYTLSQIAVNECGQDIVSLDLAYTGIPDASFSADVVDLCELGFVQFNAGFVDNLEYLWTFEGGSPNTSNALSPEVYYEVAGVYTVTLEVVNTAGATVLNVENYITVSPQPQAEILLELIGNEVVQGKILSTNATNFQWILSDGTIFTTSSFEYEVPNAGEIQVDLQLSNDCGELFFTETFEVTKTINPTVDVLVVTPNPASNVIKIKSTLAQELGLEFVLYDNIGQVVIAGDIATFESEIFVDALPTGVYILSLKNGDFNYIDRIVVAR